MEQGDDLSSRNKEDMTPFYDASQFWHQDYTKLLAKPRADLLAAKYNGSIMLYNNSRNRHLQVTRLLVEQDVDVSLSKQDGTTLLNDAL